MRRSTIILLPLILILTCCDEKARDFAKNAKAMLDEYTARIDGQIQADGSALSNTWAVYPPNPPGNVFNSNLDFHLFTPNAAGYVIGGIDPDPSFIATPTSGTFTLTPVGLPVAGGAAGELGPAIELRLVR